jgi:hypothetical protein
MQRCLACCALASLAATTLSFAGSALWGCSSGSSTHGVQQQQGNDGGGTIVLDGGAPTTEDAGACKVTGDVGLWDIAGLKRIKAQLGIGASPGTPPADPGPLQPLANADLQKAASAVVAAADSALTMAPVSVMDKTETAPTGDKHDYTSLATYWWPDPTKADAGGIPYIRKDGQIDPERYSNKYDFVEMQAMGKAITQLGLAYFFTDDEKYAQASAKLLTSWFLDPATKMNPNLNYSQEIPGVSAGRQEGVLDGMTLASMLDSVGLLQGSAAWPAASQSALETWFSQMLDWLRTAPIAAMEEASRNNHGTWYDVQATRYALLTGRGDVACAILQAAPSARIAAQISADGGGLPLELARADPFHYELYDLTALFDLATLARGAGMNLWDYQTADGKGLHKAFDFMVPYVDPQSHWPYTQANPPVRTDFVALLRRAAIGFDETGYEAIVEKYYSPISSTVEVTYPR